MQDPRILALPLAAWELLALVSIALFFAAVGLAFLCVQYRRKALWLGLVLLPLCFLLMQGFLGLENTSTDRGAAHDALKNFILDLPPWVLIPAVLGLSLAMVLLWRWLLRARYSRITPASVKEAVDNLPVALCCWLPGGRIVLANTAMEALYRTAAGEVLLSGERLRQVFAEGPLAPGCRLAEAGAAQVLLLPDGSARALSIQSLPWEGDRLTALLASDVTEAWRKTLVLEEKQKELSALNRRLAGYNREIVDLTIESEILAARVRLHDAMGEDLLTMKKLALEGGDKAGLEELRSRLRRNIGFLKADADGEPADEYTVLLNTAERLGVRTEIRGELPRTDPELRIIATGLHECLTNLLRHAHGDLLQLELRQSEDGLTAVFSGNGNPPAGEIRETGGLRSLRALTEGSGGTMTVTAKPTICVTITIPKEASYGR